MSFKTLKYMTHEGKNYAPGEIIPGAANFPNLLALIDAHYIGHVSEEEELQVFVSRKDLSRIKEEMKAEIKEEVMKEIMDSLQSKSDPEIPIGEADKDVMELQRGPKHNTKGRG